jgi:hypothetical protein
MAVLEICRNFQWQLIDDQVVHHFFFGALVFDWDGESLALFSHFLDYSYSDYFIEIRLTYSIATKISPKFVTCLNWSAWRQEAFFFMLERAAEIKAEKRVGWGCWFYEWFWSFDFDDLIDLILLILWMILMIWLIWFYWFYDWFWWFYFIDFILLILFYEWFWWFDFDELIYLILWMIFMILF